MGALALIDCNNFFVSCERLFRPELENRPVVVLSSNDGCVISRSDEAKRLGIPMGAPSFKYQPMMKQAGVVNFSANFDLYGDISQRITRALTRLTSRIEVYSVDESFLDISQLKINHYTTWAEAVRCCIFKDIGIPVAIGVAQTKTLAKLATEQAKKDTASDVLDLYSLTSKERAAYLLNTPTKNVWGVGWRLTPKLRAIGINNALDLSLMRPAYAKQLMGIHGQRMVLELAGQRCYELEPYGRVRQSIMHGRMFGQDTNSLAVIEAAVSSLSAKAARQLRVDGLLATRAVVQLSTNRHKPGYQKLSRSINLETPSADPGVLASSLIRAIEPSFSAKVWFHKANVLFLDLVSAERLQTDIMGKVNTAQLERSSARFQAFDDINARYGQSTIHMAAENLSKHWQPKRALKSPRYTTDWQELPRLNV